MAKVLPFKAVKPTPEKVELVASRSYQSYSPTEMEHILSTNPYSFLNIVNPSYKHQNAVKRKKRYTLVKNHYKTFKAQGVFKQDDRASYYVYKIRKSNGVSFSGIIAAASTEDYKNNVIKKHEDTIAHRENMFKDYLKTVGFNAEPVLLTYADNTSITGIISETQNTTPEFEFSTDNGDFHKLWKIESDATIGQISTEFKNIDSIYIADGHHRSASSNLLTESLKQENKNHTGNEPYNFFMGFFIAESELKIYEFNRLVRDLNGLSKDLFLEQLQLNFRIENRGTDLCKPTEKHQFSMYLDGEFYAISLLENQYNFQNALEALDAQILFQMVLKPILGISDLRNNSRIDYLHGKNSLTEIKNKVDSGEFAVGFGLVPATINEIKAIADQGLTMPPKSTFIQPKLSSGVTVYEF
ncbi:DUF1015 domain-containing protein [Tamlana crocina]